MNTNFITLGVDREKSLCSTAIKKYLHVNGLEQFNFLSLSTMAKSIRSETDRTPNSRRNFPCGVGGGDPFLKHGLSTRFHIFILGALRKFELNNEARTSFKIEKIKLPLTMPHPRADLLPRMPHPGEDKVVKCPKNAWGGGGMRASN